MAAEMTVELLLREEDPRPQGQDLVADVIDPKITKFNNYFTPKGGPLSPYDREMLRAYTFWLLEVDGA